MLNIYSKAYRVTALLCMLFFISAYADTSTGVGGGGVGGSFGYSSTQPIPDGTYVSSIKIIVLPTENDQKKILTQKIQSQISLSVPGTWDGQTAERDLDAINQMMGIKNAYFSPEQAATDDSVIVLVVETEDIGSIASQTDEEVNSLPVLYKDDESYFRFILNGGFGAFMDINPWFNNAETFTKGNPLVDEPSLGANTDEEIAWAEGYLHFGIGGVHPIYTSGLYAFGAATVIAPAAIGNDIFSSKTRISIDEELLYAGLLYKPDSDHGYKISVGKQNFTLNNGFLLSQFVSQANAGPRPAVYLSPRTALDFSVLASAVGKNWSAQAFYLDPNEYEPLETNTAMAGFNFARNLFQGVDADASLIKIVDSDSKVTFPNGEKQDRAGVWTVSGHLNIKAPKEDSGIWFETEIAHQWHDDYSMKAYAGYGLAGFIAKTAKWTPSISYRYAHFSGDDPNTQTYEQFDTLYSGGLSYWLQGIQINKLLRQSNRNTHRVQTNVTPRSNLHLTLDYYDHKADEENNLGGNPALAQLASKDLGKEVQFITRWYLTSKVMFQGIASVAMPGDAIKQATLNNDDAWKTIQLQLFWGL